MWIESHHLSNIGQYIVSPPGYQNPVLGDSVPLPGLQEAQHETPQPGVITSTLSHVP